MKKVKYIKRRLWAFFLPVALLAGTMPAIISAQDSNVSNTLLQEGTYSKDKITLTSIPNTTRKYPKVFISINYLSISTKSGSRFLEHKTIINPTTGESINEKKKAHPKPIFRLAPIQATKADNIIATTIPISTLLI